MLRTIDSCSAEPLAATSFESMITAHEQHKETWIKGELISPTARAIAAITIDPDVRQSVEAELQVWDSRVVSAVKGEHTPNYFKGAPPVVAKVLRDSSKLFAEVVGQDLGTEDVYTTVVAGRYEAHSANARWHVDFPITDDEDQAYATYTLALLGAPTLHTTKAYGRRNFRGDSMKAACRPGADEIFSYPLGTGIAHDGTFYAHSAPFKALEGTPRIFLQAFKKYALERPSA